MRKEAEAHADEDKAARELVDVKNQVEQIVHQTSKHLEEHGEKLGEEEVQSIKTASEELKKLAEGDDKDAIQKGLEEFAKTSQKLGELLYADAQAEAAAEAEAGADPAGAAEGTGDAGDEPVDADFEVKA
jgi:molecular chaperone DnaK